MSTTGGVFLVRHAPTESNQRNLFQGTLDVPAIPLEPDDALVIPAARRRRIFTSPLSRARSAVALLFPGEVATVDARLVERSVGAWEGLDHATVDRRWPGSFVDGVISPHVTPPGGESVQQLAERVHDFLTDVRPDRDEDLYLVTHNGWIRMALALTGAIGPDELFAAGVPHLAPVPVDTGRLRPLAQAVPD